MPNIHVEPREQDRTRRPSTPFQRAHGRRWVTAFVALTICSGLSSAGCSSEATPEETLVSAAVLGEPLRGATTDIVFRHDDNAGKALWHLIGERLIGSEPISGVDDPNWKLEATGDFDGNGTTDYAWRNRADGTNAIWLLGEDGKTVSGAFIQAVGPQAWRIVGAADMNRDGKADLIWRNQSTGENAIWLMAGTSVLRTAFAQAVGGEWSLAGAGDVDGDGQAELVWRSNTGVNVAWSMSGDDGNVIARTRTLTPVADLAWRLDAVSDLDLDGKADLLWRNTQTGQNVVWYMAGSGIRASAFIAPEVKDAGWKIAGTRRRPPLVANAPNTMMLAAQNGATAALGIVAWEVWPATDPDRLTFKFRGMNASSQPVAEATLTMKNSAASALLAARDQGQTISSEMVHAAFQVEDFRREPYGTIAKSPSVILDQTSG